MLGGSKAAKRPLRTNLIEDEGGEAGAASMEELERSNDSDKKSKTDPDESVDSL